MKICDDFDISFKILPLWDILLFLFWELVRRKMVMDMGSVTRGWIGRYVLVLGNLKWLIINNFMFLVECPSVKDQKQL